VTAGQPVQPQVVVEAHLTGTVVHGVLWLGGTFTQTAGFDPLVARLASGDSVTWPGFDAGGWAPPVRSRSAASQGQQG